MTEIFAADDDVAYAARVRGVWGASEAHSSCPHKQNRKGTSDSAVGPPYFVGRCGVLGPVDADVVTAVCGFFPESFVEKAWNEGREVDLTLAVEVI